MPPLVHASLIVSGMALVGLGLVLLGLWWFIDAPLWSGTPAKARAIRLDYCVNFRRSALIMLGVGGVVMLLPLGPLAGVDRNASPAQGKSHVSLRDDRTESGEERAIPPEQESGVGKTESQGWPGRDPFAMAGEWMMLNTVLDTQYSAYRHLQLGFHLWIRQQGNTFAGTGEKYLENGRPLPASARRPLTIQGTLKAGGVIEATFEEAGLRRHTSGRFRLTRRDPHHLQGTFISTAAGSIGSSQWTRVK